MLGVSVPWYIIWLGALATLVFVAGTGYAVHRRTAAKRAAQKPNERVRSAHEPLRSSAGGRSFLGAIAQSFSAAGAVLGGLLPGAKRANAGWKYSAAEASDDSAKAAERHPFQAASSSQKSLYTYDHGAENGAFMSAFETAACDDVIDGSNIGFVADSGFGAGLENARTSRDGSGGLLSGLRRMSGSFTGGNDPMRRLSTDSRGRLELDEETPGGGIWRSFSSLCSSVGNSSRRILGIEVVDDGYQGPPLDGDDDDDADDEPRVSPTRADRARAALRASAGRRMQHTLSEHGAEQDAAILETLHE